MSDLTHCNFVLTNLVGGVLALSDVSLNAGLNGTDLCVVIYVEKVNLHLVWYNNRFKVIMQLN